ncbi:hypothetical protein WMY93_017752 [Mugilogobius chulae]|uniref:Uncharacterized protein n=1 Tax=Mugilogobius chulae TaxID=88201 RepID=A0AAW0NP33_9GOBI
METEAKKMTMKGEFQSVVEAVKNVEMSMKEQTQQFQRKLELKEEELNLVQDTLRQQTEKNQELQEDVCRLQRESEEKSQKEKSCRMNSENTRLRKRKCKKTSKLN